MEENKKELCLDQEEQQAEKLTIEKLSKKEIKISLPPDVYSKIVKFITDIDGIDEELIKSLSTDDKVSIDMVLNTIEATNQKDVGARDAEKMTCAPKVNDKELVLKNVSLKSKGSRKAAKLKLNEALGIGSLSHVPLWHSGFWVTIKPLGKRDRINIMLALTEEFGRVGRKTGDLIFSNSSVIFTKILMEKIRPFIIDSSLALPEGEDIFDYIKIQDLFPLVLGVLKTIYPRGVNYILHCKNTVVIEDNAPKCNFRANINLDLSKLLQVDMEKLSQEHKAQMVKRGSKSVTVKEVKNYQETLEANQSDTINLTLNDVVVSINIATPSINDYITVGEYFINKLDEQINELIKNKEVIDNKEEAEIILLNTMFLNAYAHYVRKISIDGNDSTEIEDILDDLELLSENNEVSKKIKDKIIKYIDNSLVAIVGYPDYVCPECKERQSETTTGNFRAFIPLNVLNYFFIHLGHQYAKIFQELATN